MGLECQYSFKDLYRAAYGEEIPLQYYEDFCNLNQSERNALVKEWVGLADWGMEDRIGSDGKLYTAFCPLWK